MLMTIMIRFFVAVVLLSTAVTCLEEEENYTADAASRHLLRGKLEKSDYLKDFRRRDPPPSPPPTPAPSTMPTTPQCPFPKTFRTCGSGCERPTCALRNPGCFTACIADCFCPENMVLLEADPTSECVFPEDCPST